MKAGRRFIHNALLLTIVNLLLRGAGTAFLVYVSNQIGSEGIGLYQLASSVYLLAVTLATSGITTAVTRIVSEQLACKSTRGARSVLYRCLLLGLMLSVTAAFFLFTLSPWLGTEFLRDSRVIRSLQYLALGLPFLSIAAIFRGYFMGAKKPVEASGSDIVEQVACIALTIPLIAYTIPMGLEAACCGLVIASALSEVISCLYCFFIFAKEKLKREGKAPKSLNKKIFDIAGPIALSSYIRSALTSLENLLTPSGLVRHGASRSDALSQYGMVKGMAMPILFFPSAILSSFSSMLIPEVSGASAVHNQGRINFIINKCVKATLIFSLLITGMFFCFSHEIVSALYGANSSAIEKILLQLTPLVPLWYLDQIVDSILKGLNQQVSAMKYNTADSIIRIAVVFLLVPKIGINGYIAMQYIGTIFNASMSVRRLLLVSRVKFDIKRWLVLPVIAITLACMTVKILFFCPVIFKAFAVAAIYILLLVLFSCLKKNDFLFVKRVFFVKNTKETQEPDFSHQS